MRNIDKLVKFLVNDNDKETLSKSTATDIESVGVFTDYVINRILPEDFLIQEGSHVEEKDLNSLVRNFNSLLKEENLKPVIIEGMKKADIKSNQASALMSNLLSIIHEKIKILMGSASPKKPEVRKESVVKEEETVEESKTEKKKLFGFKKKEEPVEEEDIKEEAISKEEDTSNKTVDKVLMAVIGVCFVAIIGVLAFILVKVNMG